MIIIKRHGHNEEFDERKVYASCYSACLASQKVTVKEAETISAKVCIDIKKWIKNKKNIDSHQLFDQVTNYLSKYNKDVAFVYLTHKDIY